MWRKIRVWAEQHGSELLPVNPHRSTVDGLRCAPSLGELGVEAGGLDLVAILTSAVEAPLREAVDLEAAFVVVFAAGFRETGANGARREDALIDLLSPGTTRLLGPNTNLNAFELFDDLPGPALALVTQSGHQGRPLFQAQSLGVRVSHWAPTGNEADLEFADFAGWFADQPEVGAVAGYVEGFADGRSLQLALDHCLAQGTPVVVVKVGRSAPGRSMARSHTGHLTGSDRVVDGVFRQYGVTRVDGLDELQEVATFLARGRHRPDVTGLCVYGISGGSGAHLADLAGAAGLRMPRLTAPTLAVLRECIPDYLRVDNPVDCGGTPAMDERGRRILDALVADPRVGVLVCPLTGAVPALTAPLARDLAAVAATTDKPICVIWGSPVVDDPALTEVLQPSAVTVFRSFQNCVTGVRSWVDWHERVRRHRSPFAAVPRRRQPSHDAAIELLDQAGSTAPDLTEIEAKDLLAVYGIDVTRDILCATPSESARALESVGGRAVLKIVSPDIAHRSDLGLVRTGVTSGTEARRVHRALLTRAADVAPTAELTGVLVCEQVDAAVELNIGLVYDELFGPAISVGLGGVLVEVLDDLAVRVPPFSRAEARRLLAETRAARVLAGVRGLPRADADATVDLVMRLQRLAFEVGDRIAELDANPVLVTANRAVVADALVVRRPAPAPPCTPAPTRVGP